MQCSERKDGSVGKHLDYRVKPDNDRGGDVIPFPLLSFPRRRESSFQPYA